MKISLINIKFLILPVIIIAALLLSSFMFYSQINKLKDQIDNIYFGNFIPIHKLHIIKDNYRNLIDLKPEKEKTKYKNNITKNWEYYFKAYKTNEERIVVNSINNDLIKSFDGYDRKKYFSMIKKIDFLIDYEANEALKQRKSFLLKYDSMKQYLLYNIIAIVVFALFFAILAIYETFKSHSKLEKLNQKYKIDSKTDGLTKLYNRKYFDTIFDKMTEISKDNNWKSAFILLDIDYFKQYNDTYGHDKGDDVLKSMAKTLTSYFNKEYEYAFRLGGEEFGVILFDTDEKLLKNCLEGFRQRIKELNIEHKGSKVCDILTASMGVIMVDENSYDKTPRELYISADKKLYVSKENGRNRYTL